MALVVTPGQLHRRADFYFQLKSLLAAGVPMIQALDSLRSSSRFGGAALGQVIQRLQAGDTFSEALRSVPRWLPEFDLALISAGEQSGRLDMVAEMLASYYKERAELSSRLLSSLAYPIFILHFAILVFPASYLTGLMVSGGVEAFVRQKLAILVPLYLLGIITLLAIQGTHGRAWRAFVEHILNAIPLLGTGRRHLALARFSAALEALLSAGVPIVEAWELAGHASGSTPIERAVTRITPQVLSGATPAEAIKPLPVFPDMFKSLYASGEISGQLDSTLRRLYQYYQEQASLRFHNLSQWTPRLLFLIIAIAIGFQVVTFYSNYFGQINRLF